VTVADVIATARQGQADDQADWGEQRRALL